MSSGPSPGPEPLDRLTDGRRQVLQLDEVDPTLAKLALRHPRLRTSHPAGDLGLREAGLLPRAAQAGEERAVALRLERLGGAHRPRSLVPAAGYTAAG